MCSVDVSIGPVFANGYSSFNPLVTIFLFSSFETIFTLFYFKFWITWKAEDGVLFLSYQAHQYCSPPLSHS